MTTREKSKEKHPAKKSPVAPAPTAPPSSGAPDMFPASSGIAPIGEWSTAAQLFALTSVAGHPGLTDADLRRLANPNNPSPDGTAWIPKPVSGRYHTVATLAGLIRHERHTSTRDRIDHPIYASMEELETRGLIPREAQKFAARQGVPFINNNRRCQSEPIRRWTFDILRKLFAKGGPQLKDIHGMEALDKDNELAKKLREDRIKLEDEKEIRRGQLVYKDIVHEEIYEKRLAPARATIETSHKTLKRILSTIISGDGTPAEKTARAHTAITDRFNAMLTKLQKPK